MKNSIFLIILLFPMVCGATSYIGKITSIRSATVEHPKQSNQGIVTFRFADSVSSNCDWLYIDKDNQTYTSFLLAAHVQNKGVRVWYTDSEVASVGSGMCLAYTIELQ